MTQNSWPLFLDEVSVERLLAAFDIVGLMTQMLMTQSQGDILLPPESHLRWQSSNGGQARSLAMHALIQGSQQIAGVKIINSNPANIAAEVARASGLTLLFDTETGQVRAIVPAATISAARTAAVSTVAIDRCRATASRNLTFIGCGPVAKWHARLLTSGGRSCERIAVFDKRIDRAEAFAAYCGELGFMAQVATSVKEAVMSADLLVTATTTTTPYVEMDWLRPGVVVVNVSLDDLTADVLVNCDRLFVDDWSLIVEDQHRLLGRLARERKVCGPGERCSGARSVDGTIADIVAATVPGRVSESEIIVVNPFGMAAADIALADAVVRESLDE